MEGSISHPTRWQAVLSDPFWRAVVDFLLPRVGPDDVIVAPNEFLHRFPGTIPQHVRRRMVANTSIKYFALHKGMLDRTDGAVLREAVAGVPVFANEVFTIYAPAGGRLSAEQERHLRVTEDFVRLLPPPAKETRIAAFVATYQRPWALERLLNSIAGQTPDILVVDDGSAAANAERNREIARNSGAIYLRVPYNLGKAHAYNVGISHWLAHPEIDWISAFDDDVELVPEALRTIDAVCARSPYPRESTLITGHDNPAHPAHGDGVIAGFRIRLARSAAGLHLHAHRDYWSGVLPVPTQYFRAPKPTGGLYPGQGCDTDWWIACWAPLSCVKRGAEIIVVPGLVTNRGGGYSTWGSSGY